MWLEKNWQQKLILFSKLILISMQTRTNTIYQTVSNKWKWILKTIWTFFHLNISSFPYHFPELPTLLATSEIELDIIGITESRLKSNKSHLTNITLPNYNIECYGPNGGDLLYKKEDIVYKKRNDLKILKSKIIESIFIEIINPNTKKPYCGIHISPSLYGTKRIQ